MFQFVFVINSRGESLSDCPIYLHRFVWEGAGQLVSHGHVLLPDGDLCVCWGGGGVLIINH